MKCNQCDSLYINGVFCHETGCPNTNKVYNKEEGEWETPEAEYDEEEYIDDTADGDDIFDESFSELHPDNEAEHEPYYDNYNDFDIDFD